jgi:hypothetical protein
LVGSARSDQVVGGGAGDRGKPLAGGGHDVADALAAGYLLGGG